MRKALKIIFTVLLAAAEICGTIICLSKIGNNTPEIALIWCLGTVTAILIWMMLIGSAEDF